MSCFERILLKRWKRLPNGFYGRPDDWDALEAPLLRIDPLFVSFSEAWHMKLSKNYHNWPERSMEWYQGSIRKLIQIFLESEKCPTYTLWVCASEDRDGRRYWKHKTLKKAVEFKEIEENLAHLLIEAKSHLNSWSSDELGFATTLGVHNA